MYREVNVKIQTEQYIKNFFMKFLEFLWNYDLRLLIWVRKKNGKFFIDILILNSSKFENCLKKRC